MNRLRGESGQPLYQLVQQYVIQQVSSGRVGPGDELVSVRRLAQDLEIAPATVQRAYRELKARGYVVARPGRGLFVADFTLGVAQQGDEQSLLAMFRASAQDAVAMGHARTQVREALLRLAEEYCSTSEQATAVIFVARTTEIAAEYEPLLADRVGDLCQVSSIPLEGLTAEFAGRLADGAGRALLVTLIPSIDVVRAFARPIGVDVLGLVIELTPESQEALLNLDPSARLLVVAERAFVTPSVALVRDYVGDQPQVTGMALSDGRLAKAVRAAPVTICSASAAPTVRALVTGQSAVVELRYRPTTAAIDRLRRVISASTEARTWLPNSDSVSDRVSLGSEL